MKKSSKISLYAAGGALLCAALICGFFALRYYNDRVRPNFRGRSEIYVYPGTSPETVASYLKDSCKVLRPRSINRMFRELDSIAPGHYVLDSTCSSIYAARMFSHGWQTPVKLVLSGTLRRRDGIAQKISRQLMLDSAEVRRAMDDSLLLARFGTRPSQVFTLFIPDTYEVWWTASMEEVFAKQKEAYDAFWTPENKALARSRGLSQEQVGILASIVKGETNYEPEMPAIAGVYLNRLRTGMKLQADPTIAYILNYEVNRILRRHLSIDSPFNTYQHAGLPPAPIAVPTKACLNAVLKPDKHGYIYFCASPEFNGTHRFAVTYTEHLRNAREFQQALNARNAARK